MTNASHNTTSIANKPLVFVWGMSVWAPQVLQIRGCSERFDDFNDKRARPPTTKIATSNSNGISQRSASIRVFLHNSSVRGGRLDGRSTGPAISTRELCKQRGDFLAFAGRCQGLVEQGWTATTIS